jgi:hypothetical protein
LEEPEPIPIDTEEPDLSASFFAERNPLDQATSSNYIPFALPEIPIPDMATFIPAQPTFGPNTAPAPVPHAKEISLNKPTNFDGDRTKVKVFLQECLAYLDINDEIYTTDKVRIAFILSYFTDGEARRWKETYTDKIRDPITKRLNYPTFATFINDVEKAFRSADRVQEAINKLEILKQGKKTAEELVTEFRHLASMAELEQTTRSDNIHLIGLFRKALNPQLSRRILFGDAVPKTFEEWVEKAIQIDTNYRMALQILGQTSGKTRNNDNKRTNGNWYKPAEKKDPNAMDVDALTMEERQTLMKQGKCFRCKKHGHRAADCPGTAESTKPRKDSNPERFAYKTIMALTKDERDKLSKLMVEADDQTDF